MRPRGEAMRGLSCLALGFLLALPFSLPASELQMKDGRILKGKVVAVTRLAENPNSPRATDIVKSIWMLDDGLRRLFVPQFQVRTLLEDTGEIVERIPLDQRVADSGNRVARLGPFVGVTPFDIHGHRTVTMMTANGNLSVFQGVTMITPTYTKVQGLQSDKKPYTVWDMRIATSSIPLEDLKKLLSVRINPKQVDARLRVVRLFIQMELFQEAQKELEGVLRDFPAEKAQLSKTVQTLKEMHAERIVQEIKVRKKAGQHALAYSLLELFPTEDIPGAVLEQVRELLEIYRQDGAKLAQVGKELAAHVAAIQESDRRRQCEDLLAELQNESSVNTLDRLAAYWQLRDDDGLTGEEKLSLAFSGWLLGANQAQTNLSITLSLAKVRAMIERYLGEPVKLQRDTVYNELKSMEGASVPLVAGLIANMKPPLPAPEPVPDKPGLHTLQVPIRLDGEPDVTYHVQLPPGYDPHVRYPTIVTLNGQMNTPLQQIDWWAGPLDSNGNRLGQATRFGYIVIAVDWLKHGQQDYEFSAREHAAVLTSLRDASRRFSIDTDRVFLSGHSLGGNAAFDIGLSHPDLWAGVIPIVGVAEKYCYRYWKNAKLVPFYVLTGELDGDKALRNSDTLDRLMLNRYDITVIEYLGRGHESFYEDIGNIFEWMNHRDPRDFFPSEFTVVSMRPWDNFFWWAEASKMPERSMVFPEDWDEGSKGRKEVEITGRVLPNKKGLTIGATTIDPIVWLSPEVVDFGEPIQVRVGSKQLGGGSSPRRIEPDLSVLLEDVRTRGDRQHPFWAKVQ